MRNAGHDDGRGQEWLRPDRCRRGTQLFGWRARSHRNDVPRRPCRPVRCRSRRVSRPGRRPDAHRMRAAGALDRRVLRAGELARVRRRRGTHRARGRAARRTAVTGAWQPARRGPGVQLAVELGAASVDHCTYLSDADVDALAGGDDRRDASPGCRVLDPFAVSGRTPAARCGSDCRAGDRLQSRDVVHVVDAADDRARRARDAHDDRTSALVGDRRRGARRCAATTSASSLSESVPTCACWTRRATCTWPIGLASRSRARSSSRADLLSRADCRVAAQSAARSGSPRRCAVALPLAGPRASRTRHTDRSPSTR